MFKFLLTLAALASFGAQAQAQAQNTNVGGAKLVSKKPLQLVSASKQNICGIPSGGNSIECLHPEPAVTHVKNAVSIGLSRGGSCVWNQNTAKCYGDKAPMGLVKVPAFKEIVSFSIANTEYSNNACAVEKTSSGNSVKCWGDSAVLNPIPSEVVNPQAVAVGAITVCAVNSDDRVKCWGIDMPGAPERTRSLRKMVLSDFHGCISDAYGLYCWGMSMADRGLNVPEELQSPDEVQDVVLGASHTCVLTTSRKVKCWGDNTSGQLNVPELNNPTSIVAFKDTTCASDADGIKCWGETAELFTKDSVSSGDRPADRGDYHRSRDPYGSSY